MHPHPSMQPLGGMEPPEKPDTRIEKFPGEEHGLPADIPGFRPEDTPDLVEVLPDQSGELPDLIIVENRRGGRKIQDFNTDIADISREINEEDGLANEHSGGARNEHGTELKELHLRPKGKDGLKDGSFLDIVITNRETGRRLLVNSIDTRSDGRTPTTRERNSAARIIVNKETGDILVLVPKPAAGETYDRAALKEFIRPFLHEIGRELSQDPQPAQTQEEPRHLWDTGN